MKKLPNSIEIGIDELGINDDIVEAINDYLANTYGFCNKGFTWGCSIIIDNIDWDTEA